MLIKAANVSPGDLIATPAHKNGEKVSDVFLFEDGSVRLKYGNGDIEWLSSNQTIMRKDEHPNFFSAGSTQKIQDVV